MAQQIARARRRQAVECRQPHASRRQARRIGVDLRQLGEQIGRFGEMPGRPRQRLTRAGERFFQRRQNFVAQEVAAETPAVVAFIIDPMQAVFSRIAFDRGARHGQQRPDQLDCSGPAIAFFRPAASDLQRTQRRHAGRAGNPRPAQQIEQRRFGLVVAVVRQRQPVGIDRGECAITAAPRRRFQAFAAVALHFDADDVERNRQTAAEGRAEIRPRIGMWAEAVMHMQCRERKRHRLAGRAGLI